jgi:hypothetical protein
MYMEDKIWELVLEIVDNRYEPDKSKYRLELKDLVDSMQELAGKIEDDLDALADYERERERGEDE